MHKISKSDAADSDLLDIWEYTFDEWGEVQADKYIDLLEGGFFKLASNPELGKTETNITRD